MLTLLIEDDPSIVHELQIQWQAKSWSLHVATDGSSATNTLQVRGAFDLILLDLGLPDEDGLDLLKRIRNNDLATPIIILSARDQVYDRIKGLRCGADDYLVKPFVPEELEARIDALSRRIEAKKLHRISLGDLIWQEDQGSVLFHGKELNLAPREFEVLGLLLRHSPHVLPKRKLIDALSIRNDDIEDSLAEVYISRLRRRFQGTSIQIRTVRGFGYMIVHEAVTP